MQVVPFRLYKIIHEPFVAITEGEKVALTLERIGIPATCNSGGAGNFKPELAKWFVGKKLAIFHDNDEVGRKHALKVAALLSPVAESVRHCRDTGARREGRRIRFRAREEDFRRSC